MAACVAPCAPAGPRCRLHPLWAGQTVSIFGSEITERVREGRVAAVLDFECAEAGDPVMDFRVFRYWDHKREAVTEAVLRGYLAGGDAVGTEHAFRTKLGLYELLYALLRLTGLYRASDARRIEDTFARIHRIERDLDHA